MWWTVLLMACGDEPKPTPKKTPCTPTVWYQDADGDGFGDPFVDASACDAPDGTVENHGDCDDTDALEFPGAVWYRDVDGDGFGDEASSLISCVQPLGHIIDSADCDDLDSTRFPGAVWYTDADEDGYGDDSQPQDACADVTGAAPLAGDCNDDDWLVHPAAIEVCDEIDNDCDDLIDDDDVDIDIFSQVPDFEDLDSDGYGSDTYLGRACRGNLVGSEQVGDCDDTDPQIHPNRLDFNDAVDSDCDGEAELYIASAAAVGWISDTTSSAFGGEVESKDLDGDGLNELLVGAFNANRYRGSVKLIPGNLTGDRTFFPEEGRSWEGEIDEDRAGLSVDFAGDWNGDGVEDLVIGAPFREEHRGLAYIVSSDMPSGSLSGALHIMQNDVDNSYFGESVLAAGDLNDDGLDDVLIGARKDNRYGTNRGSIAISYGGDTASAILPEDNTIFWDHNGDQFGFSMANAGDPDGDGMVDFLFGAPYCDLGDGGGGCVFLFSKAQVADRIGIFDGLSSFWGMQAASYVGQQVAGVGDFDGDGLDDMLLGATNLDVVTADEGGAYLVLGSSTGWDESSLDAASHLVMLGSVENDKTGRYLKGIGDIDGDGKDDLVVTAHNSDVLFNNAGMVYGVLGGRAGGTLLLADEADFKVVGEGTNDYLGKGIAKAGDVNDDGRSDFWLGATGATSYGSLYLIEGAVSP